MQEHKEKEMEKKETKMKRAKKWNGEKRFYLFTAIGCAVALAAIVVVAVVIGGGNNGKIDEQIQNPPAQDEPVDNPNNPDDDQPVDTPNNPDDTDEPVDTPNNPDDEQVSGTPNGMISPMESVAVSQEYGFFHNITLNNYYEHKGVDFSAEVGTKVLAVDDGVVESVYKEDLLVGTQITIDHGNGVKSVYCFITEAEGLKAGDTVKKGDVIATVAEPSGNEYKQGAHLHFEIIKDSVSVDPSTYLTLEEK